MVGDYMNLYTVLLIVSIIVLFVVLKSVIKNKIDIHYAMIWILWGISLIVISLFPGIVTWVTKLLGMQLASNTIFLVFIFLLYCLSFYLYLIVTKHNKEIVKLNYEISSLKKKLEEIEKND